ncbi:diguanylate cyclase [Hyphomicrobium sp.]|uniref:diguanylate cyclase domain-containing protein n=1 Tax=Hyphomicrobium sp. TaxID=82 RepID=UPI0025BF3DB7|nr:diguanylate cyclase [Hyphomicrobium sp.]MCC7253720.1 diguanylate cyclase [Hyphomicrobium sp.]
MRERDASSGYTLVRWVGLAMGLPALIAVALLGKDTLMVVERINEDAIKRETVALERGLKLLGELNASEVLSQATRSEAFRNVVLANRQDWMRANFGSDALSSEGVQQLVIVDPDGRAVFSSADNAAPPPEQVAGLLAAAARPMERARELYRSARASGKGFGARLPGAMTDGIYVNDIVEIDGYPAMVTVSPFTPSSENQATPHEPTLLLGVQPMTDRLLDRLETLSHVAGLRHVTDPEAAHKHPIKDSEGRVVTHVTWDFSPPGYAILRAALPAIALSLGLIALMTLLAAFTIRRMTRRLAESEQTAVYASRHDTATGLANRGWFMRVFADLLAPDEGRDATYVVLLIDCDYFKSVNDTLGHAAGDAVLSAIAERLKGLGRQITIAARLGGDEFAVVTTPLARTDDAALHVRDIEDALTASVLFEGYVVMVSVSIGAAVIETPSTLSIDTWLARADMALYRAKRDGRGCARFYDITADSGERPLPPGSRTRNPADGRLKITSEHAA